MGFIVAEGEVHANRLKDANIPNIDKRIADIALDINVT